MKDPLDDVDVWIAKAKSSFITQVWSILDKYHISQSELASRMGVTRQYVSELLKGESNLTIEQMVKVANALGCKMGFGFIDS